MLFNKNILLIIFILVLFTSISGICINYQSYIIEGLANSNRNVVSKDYYAELENELKNVNDHKNDTILIDKYKKDYQNLLIETYKNTHLNMLEHITKYNNALIKNDKDEAKEQLNNITTYNSLINSINNSMKYINTNH
jgi:F0F1-type ATP synthase membrane subunit b/b'